MTSIASAVCITAVINTVGDVKLKSNDKLKYYVYTVYTIYKPLPKEHHQALEPVLHGNQ